MSVIAPRAIYEKTTVIFVTLLCFVMRQVVDSCAEPQPYIQLDVRPHNHKEGDEEEWFVVEGELIILLGKELRRLSPDSAFKIPAKGATPHSTINVSNEMLKLVWFMKHTLLK